jgi:hypothetical protein
MGRRTIQPACQSRLPPTPAGPGSEAEQNRPASTGRTNSRSRHPTTRVRATLWCLGVDDLTLGERGVRCLGRLLDAIRSRLVALVAVLVAAGSLASVVPTIYNASTFPRISFNDWVLSASGAFGTRLQLGMVLAAILLVIDRLSAGPGQHVMFAVLVALGAVGVVANLGSLIIALSTDFSLVDVGDQVAEGHVILVLVYLAPAVVAGVTCWVGVVGSHLVSANEGNAR